MEVLKVINWKELTRNRKEWNKLVPGCSAAEEEEEEEAVVFTRQINLTVCILTTPNYLVKRAARPVLPTPPFRCHLVLVSVT